MSVLEMFANEITEKGRYKIGYLEDGWTQAFLCEAGTPSEAMMVTQNKIGNICGVTYVERC